MTSFDLYEVSRGTVRLYFSADVTPTRWDILQNRVTVGTSTGFTTDVSNLAVDTAYVFQVQAVYPSSTVQSREIPYRYGSTEIAYVQTPPGPVPAP